MKQLHVFSGTKMLEHFQANFSCIDIVCTSFNEAMCSGKASEYIFSESFIKTRSQSLKTTIHDYYKVVVEPLQPLFDKEAMKLTLWFDTDMFCQINLLTLLAYLDQENLYSNVTVNILNHENEIIKTTRINPSGYKNIYIVVLLKKIVPSIIELPVMQKGIDLYLNFQEEDNEIVRYISNNRDLPKDDLLKTLFRKFQHYGLGDLQYLDMIDRV